MLELPFGRPEQLVNKSRQIKNSSLRGTLALTIASGLGILSQIISPASGTAHAQEAPVYLTTSVSDPASELVRQSLLAWESGDGIKFLDYVNVELRPASGRTRMLGLNNDDINAIKPCIGHPVIYQDLLVGAYPEMRYVDVQFTDENGNPFPCVSFPKQDPQAILRFRVLGVTNNNNNPSYSLTGFWTLPLN